MTTGPASEPTPARRLNAFIAKFTPDVAKTAKAALAKMRRLVPGAVELVYDNYNALAIGFGPSERASEGVFSIAVYPRWVSLFFLQGARLSDPEKLLKGAGSRVRHLVVREPAVLDRPGVRRLIAEALRVAARPVDGKARRRIVIKSVSARQRPRRPRA
jgi:hypothetical protein